eukprot:gene7771-9116_t
MYALPPFLKILPQSWKSILDTVAAGTADGDIQSRISLSVLNTTRSLGIQDGTVILATYSQLVEKSLFHHDDSMRILALELIALSPKNTERPSRLEISLVKRFLVLNLKTLSPYITNHTKSVLDRFWIRLRESYAKVFRSKSKPSQADQTTYMSVQEVVDFINWCSSLFVAYLYPGAPFPRKMLPLEMLNSFVDMFSLLPNTSPTIAPFLAHIQAKSTVFSANVARTLLELLSDHYDRVGQVASSILAKFPSPLPSFSAVVDVLSLLQWGLRLTSSPKPRECNAGSSVLVLFLTKYVVDGQCLVPTSGANKDIILSSWKDTMTRDQAILQYLEFLANILQTQIVVAKTDILLAAKTTPMHGLVQSISQLLSKVVFSSIPTNMLPQWRQFIQQLVNSILEISDIFLRIVADSGDEPSTSSPVPSSLPVGVIFNDDDRLDNANTNQSTTKESTPSQFISVCSWHSMRQSTLLLGAILDRIGFPATASDDANAILKVDQIQTVGNTYLHIILNTRHLGTLENTHVCFQMLCSRLFSASHPSLYSLPATWIKSLYGRINDQSLDIMCRSAGLPYAFTGILAAESVHHKRTTGPLLRQVVQLLLSTLASKETSNNSTPQIHSINILNSIFRNKTLAYDLDEYYSEAMVAIVIAHSSTSWIVRSSATLAFSTLVDRVVGVKKDRGDSSILNTATFHHVFSRMPTFHSFLLDHFTRALDNEIDLESGIYAILVLFTRLQPSSIDHPDQAISSFIPLIQRCSHSSNFMVRSISARALVPFVSTCNVVTFILDLLASLPVYVSGNPEVPNFNLVHGTLLQVLELISGHSPNLVPTDRSEMVRQVLGSMSRAKWTLDRRIAPLAYLVFNIYTELARLCPELSMFTETLAMAHQVLNRSLPTHIPMASAYIEAATAYILWSIENDQNKAPFILTMIRHDSYEVRLLAMRFLTRNRAIIIKHVDCSDLQKILLNMLQSDGNIACRKKAARLLPCIGLPLPLDASFTTFVRQEVTRTRSSHIPKKEAIPLLGHIILELANDSSIQADWIATISKYSIPSEHYELRIAVARALDAASPLLFSTTTTSLRMWQIIAKLLEDDDEDVRLVCSSVASKVLGFSTFHPAKALETVHEHLPKLFTTDPSSLATWYLTDLGLTTDTDKDGSIMQEEFSRSLVLFDKDLDNPFEERLVGLQLSARALLDINYKFDASQVDATFHRLQTYSEWVKRTYSDNPLHDRLTYSPEIFLPLYKCLVALGVMLVVPGYNTTPINTILSTLNDIQLHPLISHAIDHILQQQSDNNLSVYFLTSQQ